MPGSGPVTTTDPNDSLAVERSARLRVGYVVAAAGTDLAHRTAGLIRSLAGVRRRASSQSCRAVTAPRPVPTHRHPMGGTAMSMLAAQVDHVIGVDTHR